MLSAVAAAWHQVHNIPHLPILSCTPLFPPPYSVRPSRGANLLPTWLLQHWQARKQTEKKNLNKTTPTLSFAGRGCAAPMCHAICMDWLTLPLVPLVFAYVSSHPAWDDVPRFPLPTERLLRIMRQYCRCLSGINQLLVPLFAVSCEQHCAFAIPLEWHSVRGQFFALLPFASSKETLRAAVWGQQVWP